MMKIEEVIKGEDYDIVTFTDSREIYGVLLCGDYVEFMEFNEKMETVSITEEESPEEYNRLKDKYLEEVMKHLEA